MGYKCEHLMKHIWAVNTFSINGRLKKKLFWIVFQKNFDLKSR